MRYILLLGIIISLVNTVKAQKTIITGTVMDIETRELIPYCSISIINSSIGSITNDKGLFKLELPEELKHSKMLISYIGYKTDTLIIGSKSNYAILLVPEQSKLAEIVITGTMKEISRLESPIPVEVISPALFQKNPAPSLFESIGMVNGIQPQLNCNVCNTGDIHINGMEGPYTMILIDGMPIVSSLSTVYGLNGIPNSIVDRIEIVKGPASSLYGSEAMGGIINVITKNPIIAPMISFDAFATNWQEYSLDASTKIKVGKAQSILGINYFNYQNPVDNNEDYFTDVTLQNRISIFNKWNFERKDSRIATLAARYVYEDRWGGQMNWNTQWRGSDSIYGESIYTSRWELIGMYQLPIKERIITQFSYNVHDQNSYYGVTPYMANQRVTFIQLYWDKQFGNRHNFLLGSSFRYTYYDDNTPGTAVFDSLASYNKPMQTPLPGVFIQEEWSLTEKQKVLIGYRYDYDIHHGNVHSPRLAYKLAPNTRNIIRASMGTGYRVVNLFTEDHAALTGAREVIIKENLKPEKSYNANMNYVLKIPNEYFFIGFDLTGFYSYFTNKIIGDFITNPNEIIYDNLNGYAISQGVSLNTDLVFNFPLKLLMGISYMNVYQVESNENGKLEKEIQLHAPEWSGNFSLSYSLPKNYTIDFTGKWNGPMRLPILPNDYRPEYSPWFCIANIQLSKKFNNGLEIYGGIKNLFNFIPQDPIMRAFDPFDKYVSDPITNPNGYTFDPSYNYASLQGIRGFLGIRYNLIK